jgi:type III pantothenate kinase
LNLIADIGNNSAKFFLFNGEQILLHTRRNDTSYDVIKEWHAQFGIDKIIVSTVIDLTEEQKTAFTSIGRPVTWFNSTTATPLKIEYATPQTLGSDRIAAAVGAWNENPGNNMLVIDAGSAITIDFITNNGVYKGGNIAPGVRMRLRALHEYTGRLPLVEKDSFTSFPDGK